MCLKEWEVRIERPMSIYGNKIHKIHIVMDNLNTHSEKSLVSTFGKEKAETISRNVVFHYTPKHGSRLYKTEIEIGIMENQCLKRRLISILWRGS